MCRLPPIYPSENNIGTRELNELDMHNYVINTHEYVLEPSDCDDVDDKPLYKYIYRHNGPVLSGDGKMMTEIDIVQECLQYCGDLNKAGFVLQNFGECLCTDLKAFEDGDQSVFTEGLTYSASRYDILYPPGCFKANGNPVINAKTGPSILNHYLLPTRFLALEDIVATTADDERAFPESCECRC